MEDRIEKLYKKMVRGAWVRSQASLIMWFGGLAAYGLQVFDFKAFLGITLSVIFLILLNPPTLWLFRVFIHKKYVAYFSFVIHALEVLGYTAIVYFAGGLNVSYLTIVYTLIIIYIGIMAPTFWTLIITGFCSLSLTGMVLLVFYRIIPAPSNYLNHHLPLGRQLFDVAIITSFLILVSLFSSYTARIIVKSKKQLREQNLTLKKTQETLEQTGREKAQALDQAIVAMEKAQSSDRMKSEFLANMSHELRTPLNHIIGFNELVLSKEFGDLNQTQEDFLSDVLSSSRHLLSLINDVLDLSKVEAGRMELEITAFDLKPVLDNSLIMVKEKAHKHGIKLQTEFQDLPDTIEADERKIKQILYNLLSNAVKFTPGGGSVTLSAHPLNDSGPDPLSLPGQTGNFSRSPVNSNFLECIVSDTGIGLKAEDLERIFKPFEQADNSASRKYQGTGLGLSLTKQFVELHGGRIWAESDGEGQGCTVHFILPWVQKTKAAEECFSVLV